VSLKNREPQEKTRLLQDQLPTRTLTQTIKNLGTRQNYPQCHQGPGKCQDCSLVNFEITLQPQQDALSQSPQQTHHGQ
jgi:hypothetical protein